MPDEGTAALLLELSPGLPLTLDYVTQDARRGLYNVVLVQIRERRTASGWQVELFGAMRDTHAPRAFLSHRILAIADTETGELHDDPTGLLARLIADRRGRQPKRFPTAEDLPYRSREVAPIFDSEGLATGWHFGVTEAHKPALDIVTSTYRRTVNGEQLVERVETVGVPPDYDFAVGDLFVSPPDRFRTWGEWLAKGGRAAQVAEVEGENLSIDLRQSDGSKLGHSERLNMTQAAFAHFLRDGSTG